MANWKEAAQEASDHSDAARRSADQHVRDLAHMRESAIDAGKDVADRTAHRTQKKELKKAKAKS
jgi:hypothetical protein